MGSYEKIKKIVFNTGEGSHQINAVDIYTELGISDERFAELLARDYYCPVVSTEPTSSTLTYVDTDGSINHFAIGQECCVLDAVSGSYRMFKFMGTYHDGAVWMSIPQRISELKNDIKYATKQFVNNEVGDLNSKITTIKINQTMADPAFMVTRMVDKGGVEAIRANSHRYTGKLNADGIMELKQLNDADGTKYIDGSTANLTTIGIDVWMKLPEFYWKCTNQPNSSVVISFQYGGSMKDGWNHWDGKELIGVYEAVVSASKVYSVSGSVSTPSISQNNFKNYARARGAGFTIVKWKHHCMMAVLSYALYGTTEINGIVGEGVHSYDKINGQTDLLGMEDTVASINGNSQSINFWGLENWWGNKYEWVDDLVSNNLLWSVTEDDGGTRVIGLQAGVTGYISKMLFGDKMDLLPIDVNGSQSTYFCDESTMKDAASQAVRRSGYFRYPANGVANVVANYRQTSTSSYTGSRLVFRGDYIII